MFRREANASEGEITAETQGEGKAWAFSEQVHAITRMTLN